MDAAKQLVSLVFKFATGLISLYGVCLLVESLIPPEPEEIEPESMDGNHPDMPGNADTDAQNVKFMDTHPGYMQEVASQFDPVRDQPLLQDATLDEFFSRPLRIRSYEWGVGENFFETFNPWQEYWENPRVINRIANYKLMRCKMCVKFTINGNAFHYGRVLASYNPFPDQDQFTIIRQFFEEDLVEASQRPHVILDPTNSQGAEMCLPFFTYFNLLDITNQDWRTMGTINLKEFQDLKHANGAVDTVTINVFAWAEDVKFSIPTSVEPGSIVPQADEHSRKPVSSIAGAVAKAAGLLSNIPMIAPFAKATQIGANAVGAIATLFGYSKPPMLEVMPYIPRTKNNLAVTNTPEDITKLSVDAKQELTLDPRTVGLDGVDEMAINNIASRETYYRQFPWTVGTAVETLLYQQIVDPCLFRFREGEHHMTATAFAAWPFEYWRGTMKIRFQFVCSKYHKGRVKIVYDPSGNTTSTAEYNTAYTTVVDISDNTDFTIECGWGQNTTYREHLPFNPALLQSTISVPLTYNSGSVDYGNGTVSVYVVNELTVPNTTINNDIAVNVFVSMGDDFEVAAPTNLYIGQFGIRPPPPEASLLSTAPETEVTPLIPARERLSRINEVAPEAGETEEEGLEESKPTNPSTLNTMASKISTEDYANMIHFGERISSMRQLVKRYTLHEIVASIDENTDLARTAFIIRNNFPYQNGWVSNTVVPNQIVWPVNSTARFAYAKPTFLQYLTLAYGGWRGSIRYIVDASTCSTETTLHVDRNQRTDFPDNFYNNYGDTSLQPGLANFYNTNLITTDGTAGKSLQSKTVNGVTSFEIPYYSRFRCVPSKRYSKWNTTDIGDELDPFQQSWALQTIMYNPLEFSNMYISVSGGEDFNTFMYLGLPRIYALTDYP